MTLQGVWNFSEAMVDRLVRLSLPICVAAVATFALLTQACDFNAAARAESGALEFALRDHRGNTVSPSSLLGKPSLLFFGFTHCPDICPTTLQEMGNVLGQLGEDANHLNVLFVTLDPERDTQAHLASYLSSFDSRIIGVTGKRTDIERLAQDLGVVHERVAQTEGYSFDHSLFSFLLDAAAHPNGRMLIGHGAPIEIAVKRLRTLISHAQSLDAPRPLVHKIQD